MIPVNNEIHLEILSESHALLIFATIDSQREYLRKWLPFIDASKKVEDTLFFIRQTANSPDKDTTYVIFYQNEFAGLAGLKATDYANKRTEIGYWLSESLQGKGIVTSVCKKLIAIAFGEMGMNRVQIRMAVENEKSCAVAKRLGFTFEGIESDGELLLSGFTDIRVYSLLKREILNYETYKLA